MHPRELWSVQAWGTAQEAVLSKICTRAAHAVSRLRNAVQGYPRNANMRPSLRGKPTESLDASVSRDRRKDLIGRGRSIPTSARVQAE